MLTSVARGGETDIDQEVDTAWAAFDTEWSGYSTSRRQRIPNEIADKIEAHTKEFVQPESRDNSNRFWRHKLTSAARPKVSVLRGYRPRELWVDDAWIHRK